MTDPSSGRWFEALAEHAGAAYLRYSFTKGTEQEVSFLVGALGLRPGMRVLDVGCGPGRHLRALAECGMAAVGVDVAMAFLRLAAGGAGRGGPSAPTAATVRADARRLPFSPGSFDAAISLCQGGFGLLGGNDEGIVLAEMARVVRPEGCVAVSAFSAYFAVRHLEEGDTFDPATGVNHEVATVKNEAGSERDFDLWTTCFTPRELRLLAERAGLQVHSVSAVAPGDYAHRPPDLAHPEFLLIAGAGRSRPSPV